MTDECALLTTARARALDVLRACVSPAGFRASGQRPGYPQVWARDSIITGLGALASGDPDLVATFRVSLETIAAHRTDLGHIPLNVDPESGAVSGENTARVDSNLWFVLGHAAHLRFSGDLEFLRAHWSAIQSAVLWLRYQDVNNCGLLEIPEAGDWMDLIDCRYNVLYDNVLWYAALRATIELERALGAALHQDALPLLTPTQ